VKTYYEEHNVRVAVNTAWADGGKGAVDLAQAVLEATEACTDCFTPLYAMSWPLSDDQTRRNRPRDFTIRIRKIELSSGAGFIVPIAGSIMRMPGLPPVPSAEKIDIDDKGHISGLF
jgi:formate--tetrahydrofolate ligase